ncbi:hypothetical protein DSO57_1021140 [Entomophthora muscae]|uniref:Uncharacterized protein n=1 Tax=Entomophthora muscae TaxID=34485 RepID=A0ACC2S5M2_9FUNG|nr:hypothetical protein DSO57_1021140 [Entomophthora muscae]
MNSLILLSPTKINNHSSWPSDHSINFGKRFPDSLNAKSLSTLKSTDPFKAITNGLTLTPQERSCRFEHIKVIKSHYTIKPPIRSSEIIFCDTPNPCSATSAYSVSFNLNFKLSQQTLRTPIMNILKPHLPPLKPSSYPENITTTFSSPDIGFQIFYPLYFDIHARYHYCQHNIHRTQSFQLSIPTTNQNINNGLFAFQSICNPKVINETIIHQPLNLLHFQEIYNELCTRVGL